MKFKRTHHGKLFGIPVYLDMTNPECPSVEAKYKLDFLLTITEFLFGFYCSVITILNPNFVPMYPFLVGEEIEQRN